jgi:hypothetical protein
MGASAHPVPEFGRAPGTPLDPPQSALCSDWLFFCMRRMNEGYRLIADVQSGICLSFPFPHTFESLLLT